MTWKLTARRGSKVDRQSFEDLDGAIAELERQAKEVQASEPRRAVKMLREFEPEVQVAARFELSAGSILKSREAGLDVMGDGTLVPYAGSIRKRALEPSDGQSPFEAVREAIEG